MIIDFTGMGLAARVVLVNLSFARYVVRLVVRFVLMVAM